MKIRIGYVTNSSSTNFLILSKKELTAEYLYKKLGFKKNSPIKSEAMELCQNILYGTYRGLRYFDIEELNYDSIKETFGKKTAEKFVQYQRKGYKAYIGYTDSGDSTLTDFFTTDSFEVEERDFYVFARDCMW